MEDPPGMSKPVTTDRISLPPAQKRRLRRALAECGGQCRVVMRFSGECAAFAADQEPGTAPSMAGRREEVAREYGAGQ